MQLESNIGFLLTHLAFVLGRQNDQILQEQLGLGFSQFKLMMVLQVKPHIKQKQIADALGQTEASISRQIKLLQQKGLLQSEIRAGNRRQHITTLTSKGLRFTEEARKILKASHQAMFAQLSPKQLEQLADSLKTMHAHSCPGKADSYLQFVNDQVN
ncbi:MAG: MarR family transcriptional regulator [Candidatus Saccharimonadales bacterium]